MPSKDKLKNPVPENVEQTDSTVSEGKSNNKQNTNQPVRQLRRKAKNYFNPAEDGLLFVPLTYQNDGNAIPGVRHLYNSLIRRFHTSDVVMVLMTELVVSDYARLGNAIKYEKQYLKPGIFCDGYRPDGHMPTLTRYIGGTRRALEKTLQTMLELQNDAEEAESFVSETDEAESDTSVEQPTSSQTIPPPEEPREPVPQAQSATSFGQTSNSEQRVPDKAAMDAEGQSSNNAPQEPVSAQGAVPSTNEAGSEQPTPAAAEPAAAAEQTALVTLPKAA